MTIFTPSFLLCDGEVIIKGSNCVNYVTVCATIKLGLICLIVVWNTCVFSGWVWSKWERNTEEDWWSERNQN